MENIPHYIFDWIEKIPFEELTPTQKGEVLQYFTAVEYAQMYAAARHAANYFAPGDATNADTAFAALSIKFDALYPQNKTRQRFLTPLAGWKIAAVLLLLAVAYLSFLVYQKQPPTPIATVPQKDTVYVEVQRPVQEVKIYDTVFITIPAKTPNRSAATGGDRTPAAIAGGNGRLITPGPIGTLSMADINNGPNAPRNSSIENDTFVKGFKFVSL